MDRFEAIACLDWWANSSTNLGGIEVSAVIIVTADGWEAHGQLSDDADREGFEFLCNLDPVFTLRFSEQSSIQVTVRPATDYRRFSMTEYDGPAERQVDYRLDL